MPKYLSRIKIIKEKIALLKPEDFRLASSGTRHKVFLSDNYVIRFQGDDGALLKRESDFIKELDSKLIPKVIWSGEIDGLMAMVETRLVGDMIDRVWPKLSENDRSVLIDQVVRFLHFLKTQTHPQIYSVTSGHEYSNFFDYLIDDAPAQINRIAQSKLAEDMLEEIQSIINQPDLKSLFSDSPKVTLVHGDLINHNLLTDGTKLTGVLDWEMALWGDPDFDLFRLFYYRECAKAYQEQGVDPTFEADYMDQLTKAILDSDLISDQSIFEKKYQLVRAIFYLKALDWAVQSDRPRENVNDIINLWHKKSGARLNRA